MTATVIPTSLPIILPKIKWRLVSVLDFPPERVLISARRDKDDEPHPTGANQYVRIRALGATPDAGLWEGGERIDLVHSRQIKVTLYTRLNVDALNDDGAWATDPDLGHYQAEHQLFEALAGWFPSDANGNVYTRLGFVPRMVDEATTVDRPASGFDGWGRSSVQFACEYVLDITTSLNQI